MSENVELEKLKKENEDLKNQLNQQNQGVHNLMTQLDAHKGELADARTISLQLRTNLVSAQKINQQILEQMNADKTKLDEVTKQFEEFKTLKEATKGK